MLAERFGSYSRRSTVAGIPSLHKGKPYAPLLEKNSKSGGRNNNGRITTRHIGGGHKQAYRIVDFKRNKDAFVFTSLLTFGLNAPRCYWVFTKVTTFTTTMWVIGS